MGWPNIGRVNNEYPQTVAVETTSRCNAKCTFCPNSSLSRDKAHMSDEIFEKVIEDCRRFPLEHIEPFLNGEPFSDPKLMDRLELIRSRLPRTRLKLYTNGYALTPARTDQLQEIGVDEIFISLNTLDPEEYQAVMGLKLERTLDNLRYLADPVRRDRVARRITVRMTRLHRTTVARQEAFRDFCRSLGVRCFIVGLFNYKGDVHSPLPIPGYPCEHLTRLDVLSNGRVTLCCMDQEGEYAWGDVTRQSVLEIHNGVVARRYRAMHRGGKRSQIAPCGSCNLFWPSLDHMPLLDTVKFAVAAGLYFLHHRPRGIRPPISSPPTDAPTDTPAPAAS